MKREPGPHPNARAVYQHVENYLVGACNEEALTAWRLAIGRGFDLGWPMDQILGYMGELFVRNVTAAATAAHPDGGADTREERKP